jgi:hypothetical protein
MEKEMQTDVDRQNEAGRVENQKSLQQSIKKMTEPI